MTDKPRDAEREAFETAYTAAYPFAASAPGKFDRDQDGYADVSVAVGWRMWQAALTQQEAQKKHKPLFAEMIAQHPGLAEELAQQDAQAATCKQCLQVDALLDDMLDTLPYNSPDYWIGRIREVRYGTPCRRNNHD